MEDEKKVDEIVNEDAALDKELEDTLSNIKAGQVPQETPEVKPEEETPKAEDNSTPPSEEKTELKLPLVSKNKFESDETYEKRAQLMELVAKRKVAKTDTQRENLSEQIKTTRTELAALNGTDKFINPLNSKSEVDTKGDEDPALKADRDRLKELGGATKEDIEQMIQKERQTAEVKQTLDSFVNRHPELGDEDTREVFFDFVDSNYNWQNKGGKDLMTVLELARESMFKPSETITERVLKGANVQEKVNAMQFPGGTVAKSDYSPEMRKSIDELKATGMSEEKALELLSD